jgi:uncharacterized membrane protein YqaE (UPF0057 family)/ElaB/YqjD/DUF883 family membrane-anchored ribosome-binding protein
MKRIYLLTLVAIALIYSSCTVEKRHYMSGYHVEWNHKAPKIGGDGNTTAEAPKAATAVETEETTIVQASAPSIEETTSQQAEVTATIEAPTQQTKASTRKSTEKNVQKAQAIVESTNEYVAPTILNSSNATQSIAQHESADTDLLLLVILAIVLPPLAVYLYEGTWNNVCWLNLVLTLLFWLGAIHALLVIFEVI